MVAQLQAAAAAARQMVADTVENTSSPAESGSSGMVTRLPARR
ncbi:MAG: hypothetical protein U1U88_001758 [Lawsonella clevelandensis]